MVKRLFYLFWVVGITAVFTGCKPEVEEQLVPPNIIFIFSDDHALQAISAYGSGLNKTPNIDRLANEGMLFRHAMVGNSICAPSRATILTGLHSHLNGVLDNRLAFDTTQLSFPMLLQDAGYQTAIFGKWHLKTNPQGFDQWKVLPGQGTYYNPVFKDKSGRETIEGYTTDIITDLSLDWLQESRDENKPFLLMVQHKAPHREWSPGPDHLTLFDDKEFPEPPTLFDDYSNRASGAKTQEMTIADHMDLFRDLMVTYDSANSWLLQSGLNNRKRLTPAQRNLWDEAFDPKNEAFKAAALEGDELTKWKYQRYIKNYLRTIASVDDNIGRILDYLDQQGLAENTLVVYSSDQGFYLGEHGWYDKRWMYEESLHMPLLMRWPGVIKAGKEEESLVQNIDYAQTFLDVAGVEAPEHMQGMSLLPLMKGEKQPWREAIYYHYYEFPGAHSVPKHYGIRTDRYKLIHYYENQEWELFDLKEDPMELRSIYGDDNYLDIQNNLKTQLRELQLEYKDPIPVGG